MRRGQAQIRSCAADWRYVIGSVHTRRVCTDADLRMRIDRKRNIFAAKLPDFRCVSASAMRLRRAGRPVAVVATQMRPAAAARRRAGATLTKQSILQ
jgi:hypothetical protein